MITRHKLWVLPGQRCQSMPHKPLVKNRHYSSFACIAEGKQLADINCRGRQLLMVSCFTLDQVQAAPGNYFSNLKLPGCFWKGRFDELQIVTKKWKPFWSFPGLLLEGPTHFSKCQVFCIDYDPVFQCFFWCHSQRPYEHVPSSRSAGALGV